MAHHQHCYRDIRLEATLQLQVRLCAALFTQWKLK